MVVQRKDAFDVLPFAFLWRDTSTALRCGVRDQLVYDAQALGFVEGLFFKGFAGLFLGGSGSNTVDPVADPEW